MEREKVRLGVLDYSASQPSLESIFLAIAERDITLDRNRKAQLNGLPGDRQPTMDAAGPNLRGAPTQLRAAHMVAHAGALSPPPSAPPSAPRTLSPRSRSPRPSFGRGGAQVEPVAL